MSDRIRYRYARKTEHLETYAFVLGWVAVWLLPYGIWTWVVIWSPEVANYLVRRVWRSRAPTVASAKRSDSGVALLDDDGRRVEGFEDGDVDAVTSIVDAKNGTFDLRVERKGQAALLFEASGNDDLPKVAKLLGIDIHRARSRYRGASLAIRPLALLFLMGLGGLAYQLFGKPDAETAMWLANLNRFAFLPLVIIMSIPTVIDVGRDGVALRWLFVRRYIAFTSIASIQVMPKGATGIKIGSLRLHLSDATHQDLPLGKRAEGAAAHMMDGFEASRQTAESTPLIQEWMPRIAEESTLAWIQRLRAKSATSGTYRGTDLRELWPLAEDLTTKSDLRCAMLLVLATTDVTRERTRALAVQVVDPDVRAVYEAIASSASDEQLARLLEQISK